MKQNKTTVTKPPRNPEELVRRLNTTLHITPPLFRYISDGADWKITFCGVDCVSHTDAQLPNEELEELLIDIAQETWQAIQDKLNNAMALLAIGAELPRKPKPGKWEGAKEELDDAE